MPYKIEVVKRIVDTDTGKPPQKLGAKLRHMRINILSYPLRKLSDKTGIDPELIEDMEQGKIQPSVYQLHCLAKALIINMEYFIDDDIDVTSTNVIRNNTGI